MATTTTIEVPSWFLKTLEKHMALIDKHAIRQFENVYGITQKDSSSTTITHDDAVHMFEDSLSKHPSTKEQKIIKSRRATAPAIPITSAVKTSSPKKNIAKKVKSQAQKSKTKKAKTKKSKTKKSKTKKSVISSKKVVKRQSKKGQ
mgnify:CR=1 FL=1|tara:strand:- start:78 stop:515 length:438 start_codon:yes stop_codon:yes gene_type:complete